MLRKAHGGVLFLDEIGELGADEQAMLLRAIEEKAFHPVGSDREVRSDFQLIAGTNRELGADAFREDLRARIDLWTFRLPGLAERREDVEPNLAYELQQCARDMNVHLTFSREAREQFLRFATSAEARWPGNFRDFNGAIRRMATLAKGGRIGVDEVTEEIGRLRAAWARSGGQSHSLSEQFLGPTRTAALDAFDRVQLDEVIRTCRASPSLSEAGRRLFGASRARRTTANDADRLRKYLARFELSWRDIQGREPG